MYQFVMAVALSYFMGFFLSATFEIPISILETLFVDKITKKIIGRPNRTVRMKNVRQIGKNGEDLPMISRPFQEERREDNTPHNLN